MKTVFRFLAAHNFLTIAITFVCYRYFSTIDHKPTDYFFAFGAAFSCWLFYWLDKIKDNKNRTFEPEERHYLSNTDINIQWLTGILLAALTIYNYHTVPLKQLLIFSTAIPVSLFYLIIADKAKIYIKELFSSLIISSTICLLPILLSGVRENLMIFPAFFLMIFGNMMLLGIIDNAYDEKHQFNSLSVLFKTQRITKVLILLMIVLLIYAGWLAPRHLPWVITYCALYLLIIILGKKTTPDILHLLADSIFLFPLI